jgi:Holliday junction resolvasome RuvABC endonuclease subunit
MNNTFNEESLILSVFPSVRGFGFALFHGAWVPIDWGFRHVQGDKNEIALEKIRALIDDYAPDTVLIEDHAGEGSRRSPRVETLIDAIAALATEKGITVERYSRDQIKECFAEFDAVTKYEIAKAISESLPEFPPQLPPQRKIWLPEDYRMSIFDAVSLIFTHFYFQAIKPGTAILQSPPKPNHRDPAITIGVVARPSEYRRSNDARHRPEVRCGKESRRRSPQR